MASNQLLPDHDWPYANWVYDRIKKSVRFQLRTLKTEGSRYRYSVASRDMKILKTLLTDRDYSKGWKTVAKRIKGLPPEWQGNQTVDPMLVCLSIITELPFEFNAYKSLPSYEAREELRRLAEKAAGLEQNLSKYAFLDRRIAGSAKFFEARWHRMSNEGQESTTIYSKYSPIEAPPLITDVLRALADYLHAEANKHTRDNKTKEQFMIDGVLMSFHIAFGFGYPSFAAKVATLLCGGPRIRKRGQHPAPIPVDVVQKRAKFLKIPSR